MGRKSKLLNEEYLYGKSPEVYYTRGLLTKTCSPSTEFNNGVIFRCNNRELIGKIHLNINCSNAIFYSGNSYTFQIHNLEFRSSLIDSGLIALSEDKNIRNKKKFVKEVRFPTDIPEDLIRYYLRGIIERENCSEIIPFLEYLSLNFNPVYLSEFHKKLEEHAGVKRNFDGDSSLIMYNKLDMERIYDYLFHYSREPCIPSVKKLIKRSVENTKVNQRTRIKRLKLIKKKLNKGQKGVKIARDLGYKDCIGLYVFVKINTNMGLRKFKKQWGTVYYSIFKAFIILLSFSLITSRSLLGSLLELNLPLFEKQSLQYTGLFEVGLNGTSHELPQEEQITLVI